MIFLDFEGIAVNKLILGFLSITLGIIYSRSRDSYKYGFWFSLSLAFIGLWCILDFMQIYTRSYEHKSIANIQVAVFVVSEFLAYSIMMFNFYFCRCQDTVFFKVFRFFIFVPIVFIILLFFNGTNLIIYSELISSKANGNPLSGYFYKKTNFYYLHIGFCIFTIFVSFILTIRSFFHEQKINKSVYISIFFSIMLFSVPTFNKMIIANFVSRSIFAISEHISTFSILLAVLLSFFMLTFDNSIVCIEKSRKNLFEFIGFPVLIFDINQRFLDANNRGREFISEYGLNPDGKFSFSEIEKNKFLQKIGFPNQTVNDNSFFLYSLKTNKNFIVKKIPIVNRFHFQQGVIILIEDIERYFSSVEDYEYPIIYDEETDCIKGKYFENRVQNFLLKSTESILIVIANIQNISDINELLGIKKANGIVNEFLRILRNVNENPELFRISMSSFGFILDAQKQSEIKNIFNSIRLECKEFSVKNGIELKCRLGYTITQFNKRTALEYIDESIANMMLDHKYLEE